MAKTFNVNQTPATSALAMYNLKVLLIAAGWVVKASGDGTSLFAASDGITSGNAGAGGLGNSRAWFRIQDGAGLRELCIQRGSTGNQHYWIRYSASARFTGGAQSANTMPTAADQQDVWGSSNAGTQLFTGTESQMRFHCMADNAAPYLFYIFAYSTGGSTTRGVFMMDSLQAGSYDVGDTDPVVFVMSSTGTDLFTTLGTAVVWSNDTGAGAGDGRGIWGWIKFGLAGAGWVNFAVCPVIGAAAWNIPGGLGSNPYTGKDELFAPQISRRAVLTAPTGQKGFPNNLRWIGTQRALSADTITLSTSRDYIILEKVFALPWDGSVPLN